MKKATKTAVEIEYENPDVVDHSHDRRRTYHAKREVSYPDAAAILKLPGVETMIQHRYSIQVTKARLFSWEEVEPAVLGLLDKPTGDQWN
jgi:hypothetical protein